MLQYKIHYFDSGLLPDTKDQLDSYSLLHLVDESVRTAKFGFLKHKVVDNLRPFAILHLEAFDNSKDRIRDALR